VDGLIHAIDRLERTERRALAGEGRAREGGVGRGRGGDVGVGRRLSEEFLAHKFTPLSGILIRD
jgi:hypothetical protein